jgi:hypothetical protein
VLFLVSSFGPPRKKDSGRKRWSAGRRCGAVKRWSTSCSKTTTAIIFGHCWRGRAARLVDCLRIVVVVVVVVGLVGWSCWHTRNTEHTQTLTHRHTDTQTHRHTDTQQPQYEGIAGTVVQPASWLVRGSWWWLWLLLIQTHSSNSSSNSTGSTRNSNAS